MIIKNKLLFSLVGLLYAFVSAFLLSLIKFILKLKFFYMKGQAEDLGGGPCSLLTMTLLGLEVASQSHWWGARNVIEKCRSSIQ